jgi:7,8-dihydro-6-hydroxymethylpterin-pyrophosphokinase
MKRLLGVLKVMLLQLCWFCILSHRLKSVKSSFKIEKRLGRLRNKVQEYQSRTIDIDLIADSEIIATEKLEIPHPLMQNRNFFVAHSRFKFRLKHPILQKNIAELILLLQIKAFVRLFKIYEVLYEILL